MIMVLFLFGTIITMTGLFYYQWCYGYKQWFEYNKFIVIIWLLVFGCYGYGVYHWIEKTGFDGQNLTFSTLSGLLLWAMMITIGLLSHFYKVLNYQLIVLPIAIFSLIFNSQVEQLNIIDSGSSVIMLWHILGMTIGIFSLCFAALQSILIMAQSYALRRTYSRWLKLWPDLESMEKLLFLTLVISFFSMTVSFILGYILTGSGDYSYWIMRHVLVSCLAWLLLGFLVIGRLFWLWRGWSYCLIIVLTLAIFLFSYLGG